MKQMLIYESIPRITDLKEESKDCHTVINGQMGSKSCIVWQWSKRWGRSRNYVTIYADKRVYASLFHLKHSKKDLFIWENKRGRERESTHPRRGRRRETIFKQIPHWVWSSCRAWPHNPWDHDLSCLSTEPPSAPHLKFLTNTFINLQYSDIGF